MPKRKIDNNSSFRSSTGDASSSSSSLEKKVNNKNVHIAVVGCSHGELDMIYNKCRDHELETGRRVQFILCCGDFQSLRNEDDFTSLAVPEKYQVLGDFHKYYTNGNSDEKRDKDVIAPYLTIFIGGNHEASNVLFNNYCGGFVAPNIYYLGHSGVIDCMGVRIAGISGIWKEYDSLLPYHFPPFTSNNLKSAHHTRTFEISKMKHFYEILNKAIDDNNNESSDSFSLKDKKPVDIFLSHDWPVGITMYGNEEQLLHYKPYFSDDIRNNNLGNPHTIQLLKLFKPKYWFSAHLHCYFYAKISHTTTQFTEFHALDKCIPNKKFIDFFDIPVDIEGDFVNNPFITIPNIWLKILKNSMPQVVRKTPGGLLEYNSKEFQDIFGKECTDNEISNDDKNNIDNNTSNNALINHFVASSTDKLFNEINFSHPAFTCKRQRS